MILKFHPLDRPLQLESTGGLAILYFRYVEVKLQTLGIRGYNENVLLLVILTMTYSEKVLVMVGSKIIERVMGMIMKGELARAPVTWQQAHFSAVMSWSQQLPLKSIGGEGLQRGKLPPQPPSLLYPRNSVWMISWGMSIPHGRSLSLHLGPSIFMATQMLEGTICGSTSLVSQHKAPSCPSPW